MGTETANRKDNKFKKMLHAFIPKNVSNRVVVNSLEFLRGLQKIVLKNYTVHFEENRESFRKHLGVIEKSRGYIEDQNNYNDVKFGKVNMKISGCEIFATYNALRNMHGEAAVDLPELIRDFEKDGMILSGAFGTAPKAIRDYLKKHGYLTVFTTKEKDFDSVAENSDTLILTIYNDRMNIMEQVHTVSISKDNGLYIAHNVYCNGRVIGPYQSVSELIGKINYGKAKGISLIGVCKK